VCDFSGNLLYERRNVIAHYFLSSNNILTLLQNPLRKGNNFLIFTFRHHLHQKVPLEIQLILLIANLEDRFEAEDAGLIKVVNHGSDHLEVLRLANLSKEFWKEFLKFLQVGEVI